MAPTNPEAKKEHGPYVQALYKGLAGNFTAGPETTMWMIAPCRMMFWDPEANNIVDDDSQCLWP